MADGETAATAYAIGWEPQPEPQTALLACPVFDVFFGGARGGGKTDGMLGEWAPHADLHGKNVSGFDGPSRAGAAPRDHGAKPANLCPTAQKTNLLFCPR